MGSSKFFDEGMENHIKQSNTTLGYVGHLSVGNNQSSIANGGLYLKAQKDYVDFSAPFI